MSCALLVLGCGASSTTGDGGGIGPVQDVRILGDSGHPTTRADAGGISGSDVPLASVDTGNPPGVCVPSVPRGQENTDALCSNGIDDDCNGHIDCDDYHCSRNSAVTVCVDGGLVTVVDAGSGTDSSVVPRDVPTGPIGPNGGSMSLLHFAAFGDSRPPSDNDTANYPTAVIQQVFQGIQGLGVPFTMATGDYMFAITSTAVSAQLDLFQSAEAMYSGYVFHVMGNHECNGQTASNCPNLNEYPNVTAFRTRLQADLPNVYHDFTVSTSLGDAHFIMVAANAWTPAQETWLQNALSVSGPRYTFVFMHEPPNAYGPPAGATTAEGIIDSHTTTLRIYGHTHEYSHQNPNIVITGNAGAPLQSPSGYYGFLEIQQRSDGNIVVNEYRVGSPSMLSSSFVVTPSGSVTH